MRRGRGTWRISHNGTWRISHNGALCIGNLNRMGRVDRAKWVGLHCYHQDILRLYVPSSLPPSLPFYRSSPRPPSLCHSLSPSLIQSKNILVIAMRSVPSSLPPPFFPFLSPSFPLSLPHSLAHTVKEYLGDSNAVRPTLLLH